MVLPDAQATPSRAHPLESHLEGAVWPLGRESLVAVARENGAPAGVLTCLAALPAGPHRDLGAVLRALEALAPQQQGCDDAAPAAAPPDAAE